MRLYGGFIGKAQGLDKTRLELGEVVQRAAQERHVAVDGAAASQTGDSLRDHRLEDRGGDVLFLSALVEQRLDIGLGKDTAARCDGVDDRVVFGELVEAAGIRIQKACHLVDKRTRTACAGTVHALLDAAVKVDDLGIFSAKLDRNICLGDERLDSVLVCDDLLDKGNLKPASQKQAAATGDGHSCRNVSHLFEGFRDDLYNRSADVGVVTAIDGIGHVVCCIQCEQLDGGRPDIDADTERAIRSCCHVVSILQGAFVRGDP